MTEKLLPCPFCGGKCDIYPNFAALIECRGCKASFRFPNSKTMLEKMAAFNRRAQPENKPLTCDGCECRGEYENEVEYGYPSPCTACQRRAVDNYRYKPEEVRG